MSLSEIVKIFSVAEKDKEFFVAYTENVNGAHVLEVSSDQDSANRRVNEELTYIKEYGSLAPSFLLGSIIQK